MKHTFFAMLGLLLSFTTEVRAEWTLYMEEGGYRFYIDPETIKQGSNGKPRVWVMSNLPKTTEKGERSSTLLLEANCADDQVRFLAMRSFPKLMGKGLPIEQIDDPTSWIYTNPHTNYGIVLNAICTKTRQ